MKMRLMIVSAVLLAAAGAASAQMAPRMPTDYDILNRVSIFSRDRQVRQFSNTNSQRFQNSTNRRNRQRNYTPILAGAIVEDDGYFIAFIADPSSGFMTGYRVGDILPDNAGTIKEITLDDITTIAADHSTKKIDIGETITGGAAEYPSADGSDAATTGPAGGDSGPDGSNGGPPSPPSPGGDNNGPSPDNGPPAAMSASPSSSTGGVSSGGIERLAGESTLDYMKRRRALQLKK